MPAARIETLAYGPHGVARVDGKVHFVRSVAPGDEVEIAVREDRGTYAYADPVRLLAAGPARRAAPCPYLPRCGGCPWQHVADAAQAEAKERVVRDLLTRVGRVEDPPLRPILRPAPPFGYRRRLGLRVAGRRVGFLAAASHDLVPVAECLLAAPALAGGIGLAAAWVEILRTPLNRIEVALTGEGDRVALVAQAEGAYASADAPATERFLAATPRIASATLHGRGWRHTFGDDRVVVPLAGGDAMHLHAGDFVQVGDAANAELVRVVLDMAGAATGSGAAQGGDRVVADLYAGAGNLTLPLARRFRRVLAVERSRSGAEALRANARRLGLDDVEVTAGDVPRTLADWLLDGVRVDVLVLDPPRSGAAGAVERIARLAPQGIVYVSCDPATLARDVRALGASYRLEAVQPIDFFPQTYHVETVALLLRR